MGYLVIFQINYFLVFLVNLWLIIEKNNIFSLYFKVSMILVMLTGVFEDFNKLKSDNLASNSNFIFKVWANFKEKIMEM